MILLKMFIAILDGQFTDLNSGKSDPSGIDKMGFFELIIFLLKNNIDGLIAKVEEFQNTPGKNCIERAFKSLTDKALRLIKLIKSILLGSELDKNEKKRLKEAKDKNVMKVKLKYNKDLEEEKKREQNLDGLEYYINRGVVHHKKRIEEDEDDVHEGKILEYYLSNRRCRQ